MERKGAEIKKICGNCANFKPYSDVAAWSLNTRTFELEVSGALYCSGGSIKIRGASASEDCIVPGEFQPVTPSSKPRIIPSSS